ncbi:MAG TPA: hypothetical protein VE860_16945, partial [Chthoniobacterales bacterium]|nr:hypothetical protein [Chthoniobacterales bacterium]
TCPVLALGTDRSRGFHVCVWLQMISQAIKKTSGRRIGAARPNQNVKRLPWISGKSPAEATCVA